MIPWENVWWNLLWNVQRKTPGGMTVANYKIPAENISGRMVSMEFVHIPVVIYLILWYFTCLLTPYYLQYNVLD